MIDLWRTRLSRGRIIRLLPIPPPPPSPLPSAICISFSIFLCVASRAYGREKGGGGGGGGAKPYDRDKAKGRQALPLRSFPVVLSAQHIWFCNYPRVFFIFFFTGRDETFKGWTCCTGTVVYHRNFPLSDVSREKFL